LLASAGQQWAPFDQTLLESPRARQRSFVSEPNLSDERLQDLQERFAWLERHSTERDLEILALSDRLRKLERLVEKLKEKAEPTPEEPSSLPEIERPPHY
jgi:chromosome segregation ATPase